MNRRSLLRAGLEGIIAGGTIFLAGAIALETVRESSMKTRSAIESLHGRQIAELLASVVNPEFHALALEDWAARTQAEAPLKAAQKASPEIQKIQTFQGEALILETQSELGRNGRSDSTPVLGEAEFARGGRLKAEISNESAPNIDAIEEPAATALFWIWILAVTGATGIGLLGYKLDRKSCEREEERKLRESVETEKSFLALVAERTSNGVLMCNLDKRIVWANAGFEALSGYTKEEYLGKTPKELLQCDQSAEETREEIKRCIEGRIRFQGDILNRKKSGEEYWVRLEIQPIEDREGNPKGFVGIQTDISERIRREENEVASRLKAEAANEAKSRFVASMSHEIRTPLNGVIGFCELLKTTEPNEEQRGYLEAIENSGEALLDVIDEILDFSKIEAGRMTPLRAPMEIKQGVEAAAVIQRGNAELKNLEIEMVWEPNLPTISTDKQMLGQIIGNLLSNAVKFTEEGKITITTLWLEKQGRLRIEIQDSGIGIPPEKFEEVFIPFTQEDTSRTRQKGGTGLGLTISRKLAQLLGGSVWIEPSAKGTKMIVETEAEETAPAREAGETERMEKRSILVVEDHAMNRRVLLGILKKWGHETDHAENGLEAIEKAAAQNFDVILMDIHMPVMDGIQATKKLRERGYSGRIYALSADAQIETRSLCLESGMDGVSTKPYRVDELKNLLR